MPLSLGILNLKKIPVSKERQMNYIEDKLNELREIKTHSENKYTVKEAEQSISGTRENNWKNSNVSTVIVLLILRT